MITVWRSVIVTVILKERSMYIVPVEVVVCVCLCVSMSSDTDIGIDSGPATEAWKGLLEVKEGLYLSLCLASLCPDDSPLIQVQSITKNIFSFMCRMVTGKKGCFTCHFGCSFVRESAAFVR